jgi:hypothetical protein
MGQSLHINGKTYIQSNVLALRFNYTPDYIGKLAREEKILGTQIGRQWFIEEGSLETFLRQAEIQKNIRKEELSLKRKAEHVAHQKLQKPIDSPKLKILALAEAVAVMACVFLAGSLGFVATDEGLGAEEFALGAQESVALIAESILPFGNTPAPQTFVASTVRSVRAEPAFEIEVPQEPMVFADLPQTPAEIPSASSTEAETVPSEYFSDEVVRMPGEEGEEYVVPVFRNGVLGLKRYVVTPINAQEN